jgi:hypothetical protein
VLAHLAGPEAILHGEIYSAANDRDQAAIVYDMLATSLFGFDACLGVQAHARELPKGWQRKARRLSSTTFQAKTGLIASSQTASL